MAYQTSEEGRQGLPDVTAKELIEIIKNRFKNKKVRPTPILILGKAGVGKTESVYAAVKELGIGLKEVVLSEYESTDLAGLPKIMERSDIGGLQLNNQSDMYVVEHIRPRLLPDPVKEKYAIKKYCETTGKRPEDIDIMELPPEARQYVAGILFFDEVPAACRENRIAASKLLDKSRRIGEYILPSRWLVICAGNGPEDAGQYDDLEPMFFNRCQGFRFEPDVDNWIEWATKHDVYPAIIAFIKTNPDLIWDADVTNATYSSAFPSPRAWTNASIELKDFINCKPEGYSLTERDIFINIAGIVGTVAANKFIAFYSHNASLIPLTDIEEGTARININDGAREAAYLQASIVANHLNKRAEEYNKNTTNKDFTKIKNILNWVGNFANANLDAGLELIREALHGGTSQISILLMSNYELVSKFCPDFINFYKEHASIYQYN